MATINIGSIKFNWKGPYNNGTTYAVDDVVSSGGSSYVCILASTGNAVSNGTYWQIMSSAGSNGTDLTSTLSTRGDIVYKGASALERLAKGTSGYFLKQGANDPEWGAVDLTNLSASNLTSGTIPNARYGTPTFNGSNLTNLPGGGKILQVVSTTKNDTWSSSGTGFQAVTGLSLSITPAATSSKVFITSHTNMYQNDYGGGISLYRGGSQIVQPSSPASRSVVNASDFNGYGSATTNIALQYLDAPSSTSSLTYQIYVSALSGTYHVNRSLNDTNTGDRPRTISTITAMEVSV